ncbi:hypothetical protein BO70DRAFT_358733, partial [Aspergillus heteromorphus CBS 117.55]
MAIPDASIHPEATGPAKALVAKHQAEQPLKLYAGWFCPFGTIPQTPLEPTLTHLTLSSATRLACPRRKANPLPIHRSQPLPQTSLIPRPQPARARPHHLRPRPILIPPSTSHHPLYESTVILEYLEEAYPTHTPLLPSEPYQRAKARIWIDFVTSRIIPSFHRFLQYQPPSPSPSTPTKSTDGLTRVQQDFLSTLKQWTAEMHPTGPYFLGSEISLPDLVLGPWAVRFWVF